MIQIFSLLFTGYGKLAGTFVLVLGLLLAVSAFALERQYRLTPPPGAGKGSEVLSLEEVEAMGAVAMKSSYFDRAFQTPGARFRAVSLSSLLSRYDPEGQADAVVLDCFDDYQGLITVQDIRRYDLWLATRIDLPEGTKRPDWLQPLLVLVPDGKNPPFQERFATANIRGIRFVDQADYYAPLKQAAGVSTMALGGFQIYADNCLFCHPVKAVGGNKGGALTGRYDFASEGGLGRFEKAFLKMHRDEAENKQNMEQFVSGPALKTVARFLDAMGKRDPGR